jgi:phosphoglycolate phosphatase-like HAD superfamily hydrolase
VTSPQPKVVLFWDLDGTLLTTGRAGMYAFEEAVTEVTGVEVDLQDLTTAGLTDWGVATLVLEHSGVEATPERIDAVLRAYERRLPDSLPRRVGRVLEGVQEALADLSGDDRVHSYLLTGNTPSGARAKLRHYGLDGFFPEGEGAFSIDSGLRVEIARRALAAAPPGEVAYVIGDTPADIDCGKAIGARTIAVTSGWHSREELAAHDPWIVLDRIPEPVEFRRLIGLS